jgi:hypothetical protein
VRVRDEKLQLTMRWRCTAFLPETMKTDQSTHRIGTPSVLQRNACAEGGG